MVQREYMSGNSALAFAVKLAQPDVVAVYPITPQTSIIEKIAEFVANKEMNCELITVESEHSALAACFGAACTGQRTFTATASQGLAYMSEMLPFVSGNRFPIVMAVVNRGMAAPWTIWGDHQDAISQRDTGWVQIYVENAQDALDTCLQAYRLAEDPEILLPVMVCLDGFTVSHTDEIVEIEESQKVRSFLPPYKPTQFIDFDNPITFSTGVPPDHYMEYKASQQAGMEKALITLPQIAREFTEHFGRSAPGLLSEYYCEDADHIIVAMGSVVGTIRAVVGKLRAQGKRVGVLAVRSYRPFPAKEIAEALSKAKTIGVLDRDCSYGFEGALSTDVRSVLFGVKSQCSVLSYIGGLGGRDIRPSDIERIFADLEDAIGMAKRINTVTFIGLRERTC